MTTFSLLIIFKSAVCSVFWFCVFVKLSSGVLEKMQPHCVPSAEFRAPTLPKPSWRSSIFRINTTSITTTTGGYFLILRLLHVVAVATAPAVVGATKLRFPLHSLFCLPIIPISSVIISVLLTYRITGEALVGPRHAYADYRRAPVRPGTYAPRVQSRRLTRIARLNFARPLSAYLPPAAPHIR